MCQIFDKGTKDQSSNVTYLLYERCFLGRSYWPAGDFSSETFPFLTNEWIREETRRRINEPRLKSSAEGLKIGWIERGGKQSSRIYVMILDIFCEGSAELFEETLQSNLFSGSFSKTESFMNVSRESTSIADRNCFKHLQKHSMEKRELFQILRNNSEFVILRVRNGKSFCWKFTPFI